MQLRALWSWFDLNGFFFILFFDFEGEEMEAVVMLYDQFQSGQNLFFKIILKPN